jgi:hypothetical protein
LQSKTIRPVNSGIAFKYNDLLSKVERSRGNIIGINIGYVSCSSLLLNADKYGSIGLEPKVGLNKLITKDNSPKVWVSRGNTKDTLDKIARNSEGNTKDRSLK